MSQWVFTVSEFADFVKRVISAEDILQDAQLRGEISGCRRAASGHIYFTLKDASAQLQCVWFKQEQFGKYTQLTEGMQVVLTGRAAFYTQGGQLNFYVSSVKTYGAGSLYLLLERLKARLSAEGLFDEAHKRPLPLLPRTIGVITSAQGAVLWDILRIVRRRAPMVDVLLYPVRVQGEDAGEEIARGIRMMNQYGKADVLIVGRGGGSFEDLYEFNDEEVVRAVYESKIPVVSAVGHETDYTLCDFAADVRAATPSEAAEIVTAGRAECADRLQDCQLALNSLAQERFCSADRQLTQLQRVLKSFDPLEKLSTGALHLDMLEARMAAAAEAKRKEALHRLEQDEIRLKMYDYRNVLSRGYALVRDARTGSLITQKEQAGAQKEILITLQDGELKAITMGE